RAGRKPQRLAGQRAGGDRGDPEDRRNGWRGHDGQEIAAQTGMSIQTVRRRLRLRSLTPVLRVAFDRGRITASVAEAAARLPEPEQKELADELAQQGRLTLSYVRHVARERSVEAKSEL